jgi:tetratricopeptide (TPR) repeat protein
MSQAKDFAKVDKLVAKGNFGQAIGILNDSLKTDKHDTRVWAKLGEVYQKKGDKLQSARCYWEIAKLLAENGFYPTATVELKKVIALDSTFFEAYEMLIDLYNKLGQSERAKPYEDTLAKMKENVENLLKAATSALDDMSSKMFMSKIDSLISTAQAGDSKARQLLKKIQRKVNKALQPVKMAAKKHSKK